MTQTPHFRVHGRLTTCLKAKVTHIETGWQRDGTVVDMGLGGARITLADPAALGDIVTLSIPTERGEDPIVFRTLVTWSAAGEMGVTFDVKSVATARALVRLAGRLDPDEALARARAAH